TPTIRARNIPPIAPPTVLFGLIAGHNLRLPNDLPTKYAPESVPHTMNKMNKKEFNPAILVINKNEKAIEIYNVEKNTKHAYPNKKVVFVNTVNTNRTIINTTNILYTSSSFNPRKLSFPCIMITHMNGKETHMYKTVLFFVYIRINSYKPIVAKIYVKIINGNSTYMIIGTNIIKAIIAVMSRCCISDSTPYTPPKRRLRCS